MRRLLYPFVAVVLLSSGGARAAFRAMPRAGLRQEARLDRAKAALERLHKDPRHRRYRHAWERVIRRFEGAARVAPAGPRAAEARLGAAQAREQLWNVSRRAADARAAVAAYRRVDENWPGTQAAAQALLAAAKLASRTGDSKAAERAARRLATRYPGSSEASAALRLAHGSSTPPSAGRVTRALRHPGRPSGAGNGATSGNLDRKPDHEHENEADRDREPDRDARASAQPEGARTIIEPENPREAAKAPSKAELRHLRAAALASPGGSVAEQLGLKVRKVVIDPGHGGRDTGAIGPRGSREKDVALAIAKKLAAQLRALGLAVVLIRTSDVFVSLDDRTRIANEAKADLFVSIHCNAARRRNLAGVETWTLNVASDRYAARLAAFENAEAERRVSDLRFILADLATKANAGDARQLAEDVQESLVRNLRSRAGRVPDHGTKQALFYVLLGARMPAVLVETGFISNPAEEIRLRSRAYQEGIAEGIAHGIHEFVDGRQKLARAP